LQLRVICFQGSIRKTTPRSVAFFCFEQITVVKDSFKRRPRRRSRSQSETSSALLAGQSLDQNKMSDPETTISQLAIVGASER
jgi:hypothetical protein